MSVTVCILNTTGFVYRRQKEVVTPMLFEIAQNGDKDKLFQLLEDDDDVNPSVSSVIIVETLLIKLLCMYVCMYVCIYVCT